MIKAKPLTAVIVVAFLLIIIPTVIALQKTFTVQETDLVTFKPLAKDPDLQEVTYQYTKPVNFTGQWQTTYDDTGEYGIDITASDGVTSTIERITLIVTEKNRPPNISLPSLVVKEGDIIFLELQERDADGQRLQYIFEQPFNSDGTWTTTHNDAGEYSFEIKVSDGELISEFRLDVMVLEVDRSVFLNVPEEISIIEGEELLWEIDVYDPDADPIDLKLEGLPESAALNNGTVRWTPTFEEITIERRWWSDLLLTLQLGPRLNLKKGYPILVKACSRDHCENRSTNLIVSNVNRKPEIELLSDAVVKIGDTLKLNLTANDPDGEEIKYSFSQPLSKLEGIWKPKRGEEGEYIISVIASDGLEEATLSVKITVLSTNQPPSLIPKVKTSLIEEGKTLEIDLQTYDPDDDQVVISIEDPPEGAALENGRFIWRPDYDTLKFNENGRSLEDNLINKIATVNGALSGLREVKELTFTASDGYHLNTQTVKVIVKNVNQKPEIIDYLPDREITAKVGESIIFNVAAKDRDEDRLDYEWSFSIQEPRIKGTNTIERTFVTPGKKKVNLIVSDGKNQAELTWVVNVVEKTATTETKYDKALFKVYVVEKQNHERQNQDQRI